MLCVGQLLEIIGRFNPSASTTLLGIQYRKKENIIILITKQESIELQKLGHRFGSEGTLHHTYTSHKKYFLTESKQALADLEKIRKSRIVEK